MLQNAPRRVEAIPGRIVLVCGSLAPGGAERQVVYTLAGLAAHRLESVQLLCHYLTSGTRHRYDFYLPAVQTAGIRAREIRRRTELCDRASMPDGLKEISRLLPPELAVDIAHLYSEFSELRPEVVHTWLDWDNVRGGLAAALAGVPRVVISGRNVNPSHFALYQPYMDPAYRVLAQLPNVIIINNSRAGADDYADWIGIPRDRIKVVHNAVDFGDRKRLSVSECADLRALLEIPEGSFVIGGVFRLEEEKRPLLWVQTAALLARQIPHMHFVIFGQGTKHDAVLEAAEREGISHRLTLAGVTNDVLSAMSIMDLFLLTSFGEGLPNVVLEAQWAGTPVVVTDVGGAKEAIEPGVTGWAVDTDAPQDLAARIKWLHDNPAVLQAARIKGPQWVRQQFGITRMIEETVRVYGLHSLALAGDTSCARLEWRQRCEPRFPSAMKQPTYSSEIRAADAFRRVLGAYETRGFSTAAIRQWCIPELDAEMLVEATRAQRPKRILEVGTYVGVSTLLMAVADPAATIVTIDPSLPLAVEMGSMASDLGGLESMGCAHDVARVAARELGVEDRIQFVEGGFAIGDTFASIRSDPGARVPVVGPAVCAKHGPFDLIFIDGLHYVSAVERDLRLAAEALAPRGVILMHDCIGMWGTNVRAGIFRFLADRSEFRLSHPKFGELYRSMGLVFRADEHPDLMKRFRSSEPDASATCAMASSIVSSITRRLEPDFVIELAAGAGVSKTALETAGVSRMSFEVAIQAGRVSLEDALAEVHQAWQSAGGRDGLLVSFGLVDHLSEAQLRKLLGWIRDQDLLAVLCFTPPGEVGVAGPNSRSFRHMVRLIAETGLSVAALSRFDADPVQFAFVADANERPTNSFCIHTAVVGSSKRIAKAEQKSETPILTLNEVQAEAFEQETLLRLHYARGFDWVFRELSASRDQRRSLEEQVARYQLALDERQQEEVELRRWLDERQQEEVELRHQLDERQQLDEEAERRRQLDERQQQEAERRRRSKNK